MQIIQTVCMAGRQALTTGPGFLHTYFPVRVRTCCYYYYYYYYYYYHYYVLVVLSLEVS